MLNIKKWFVKTYLDCEPKTKEEFKRSRVAFTVDGVTAGIIALVTANAYLAGYLDFIGIPPALNGIINAVPALTAFMQFVGAYYMRSKSNVKWIVSFFALAYRLLMSFMFVLPLFIEDQTARMVTTFAMFLAGYILNSFISPGASNWIASLTPQRLRGRYFSFREMINIIACAGATITVGFVMDYFKDQNAMQYSYYFLGGLVLLATVVNFVSLSMIKEPKIPVCEQKQSFMEMLKLPFTIKVFRPVLVFNILWQLAFQITYPFYGLYTINNLGIDYRLIGIMSTFSFIWRAIVVRYWGRMADRKSWSFVLRWTLISLICSQLINATTFKVNAMPFYIAGAVIGNIAWAGIGVSTTNVLFDYAPSENRTMLIGANAAISGLFGFGISFFGGYIMDLFEKLKLEIRGLPIAPQQILMLISTVILIFTVLYIKLVIEKNKVLKNAADGYVKPGAAAEREEVSL